MKSPEMAQIYESIREAFELKERPVPEQLPEFERSVVAALITKTELRTYQEHVTRAIAALRTALLYMPQDAPERPQYIKQLQRLENDGSGT